MSAFALGFGAFNLFRRHSKKISQRAEGEWPYSILLIITLVGTILAGLYFGVSSDNFQFLFQNLYASARTTIFSLLAFYIVSAAYRVFRLRNIDAALLLAAGGFVMLGNTSIGEAMWPGFLPIREWLMNQFMSAVYRGILIGVGIGAISYAVRILAGFDRGIWGGVGEDTDE